MSDGVAAMAPMAALGGGGEQDPAGSLDRDGYAVMPELLDRPTLQTLCRDLAESCLSAADPQGPAPAGDGAVAGVSCLQFPHLASRRFLDLLVAPKLAAVLRHAIGPAAKLMQSIVLMRQAGTPGLDWHQDRHYLDTGGGRLIAVWIALDDARIDNGCLWVLPESHRGAILWTHTVQEDGGIRAIGYPFSEDRGGEDRAVPLEVDAGTAILFDGHLLHRSARNRRTTGFRRALIGHYSAAGTPSPWDGDNTFLALDDGGRIEIVGGAKPYAHRG